MNQQLLAQELSISNILGNYRGKLRQTVECHNYGPNNSMLRELQQLQALKDVGTRSDTVTRLNDSDSDYSFYEIADYLEMPSS